MTSALRAPSHVFPFITVAGHYTTYVFKFFHCFLTSLQVTPTYVAPPRLVRDCVIILFSADLPAVPLNRLQRALLLLMSFQTAAVNSFPDYLVRLVQQGVTDTCCRLTPQ